MKTSQERREYIRTHFALLRYGSDSAWVAIQKDPQGKVMSSRANYDYAALRAAVRRDWGHFNFEDEAEEFAKIFPPTATLATAKGATNV